MLTAIICIILLVLAAVLTFVSAAYGTAVAFLGLCVAGLLPGVEFGAGVYMFWGVAMIIVIALYFILPRSVSASRVGIPYIVTATLAGMLVGLAISHAAMIIGAVVAAVLGGVTYARTPSGGVLGFPSAKFWNYLCAKGLPAVIAFCTIGTAIPVLVDYFGR